MLVVHIIKILKNNRHVINKLKTTVYEMSK